MILTVNSLNKSYAQNEGTRREVLQDLSLEVNQGESLAIIGPSGSGKSTLLNILGSMEVPDSGEILYKGKDIALLTEKERLQYRNQELGFVYQQHHLLPQCNVLENVLIPTLVKGKATKAQQERAEQLLKQLAIWDLREQKPSEMSVGECQRTAIARALINNPSLLLADEPSGALDEKNAATLAKILLELKAQEELALIVVTHDLNLASKMDRVYQLNEGKLAQGFLVRPVV